MEDVNNIEAYIEGKLKLLPFNNRLSAFEAQTRAASLLMGVASLAGYRKELNKKKIEATSLVAVTNRKLLSTITEKMTAPEKKATVEAHPEYIKSRENEELCENDHRYISCIIDVLNNAHLMFRQIAKEDM